jgi:uncharacterized damage-inducible protein DinB
MSPKDVLRGNMAMADNVVNGYIADLNDSDLMIRPVPGMNHIAWQLGHIISAERHFAELISPGSSPALPEGFDAAHSKEAAAGDDPSKFRTLAEYQSAWKAQRAATLAVLDAVPEADLGKADPDKYPPYAPTVAALLGMIGLHPLMHAGQFVAVRRLLGKPISM